MLRVLLESLAILALIAGSIVLARRWRRNQLKAAEAALDLDHDQRAHVWSVHGGIFGRCRRCGCPPPTKVGDRYLYPQGLVGRFNEFERIG
jgi:hypothetical protein